MARYWLNLVLSWNILFCPSMVIESFAGRTGKEGSEVESTDCSSRVSGFNSQHPYGSSQLSHLLALLTKFRALEDQPKPGLLLDSMSPAAARDCHPAERHVQLPCTKQHLLSLEDSWDTSISGVAAGSDAT